MKVKALLSYCASLLYMSLLFSCSEKKGSHGNEAAETLFENSVATIQEFTKKMSVAKDTAEVEQLLEHFDKQITDVNFSVPPETDLKLTEQENDSLVKLLIALKNLKEERLLLISSQSNQSDSIE